MRARLWLVFFLILLGVSHLKFTLFALVFRAFLALLCRRFDFFCFLAWARSFWTLWTARSAANKWDLRTVCNLFFSLFLLKSKISRPLCRRRCLAASLSSSAATGFIIVWGPIPSQPIPSPPIPSQPMKKTGEPTGSPDGRWSSDDERP